jgi:hypothetical protein
MVNVTRETRPCDRLYRFCKLILCVGYVFALYIAVCVTV